MRLRSIVGAALVLSAVSVIAAIPAFAGDITGKVKPQGLRSAQGILVYVVKGPAADTPKAGKFSMDQNNLSFKPHVLPITVGSQVSFPNNDKVDHNVFSLSKAKKFNLGSYKPGQEKTVTFDQPGVVELRCDVHQDMKAFILVLKNPFFALTRQDGGFDIKGLPAGAYRVKTWHEKLRASKAKVNVPASGTVEVSLSPRRGPAGVLYK